MCCPLGCAVCIILIFETLTSSVRRPFLPVTPDGPTDGHSDVLLVRWLRLQSARHTTIHHLTIQFSRFVFNLPVNDRYVAASHKTIKQWSWLPGLPVSVLGFCLPCLLVLRMCGVCRGADRLHTSNLFHAFSRSWLFLVGEVMSDPLAPPALPQTAQIHGDSDCQVKSPEPPHHRLWRVAPLGFSDYLEEHRNSCTANIFTWWL